MDGGGAPVNFSTLHTCLNYDGTQPWRAVASLAFNGGLSLPLSPVQISDWHSTAAGFCIWLRKPSQDVYCAKTPQNVLLFFLLRLNSVEAEAKICTRNAEQACKPAPLWVP